MKIWFLVSAAVLAAGSACAQSKNAPAATNLPPARAVPAEPSPAPVAKAEAALTRAGTTNAAPGRPTTTLRTRLPTQSEPLAWMLQEPKANEWVVGKLTYSGVAVQAVRAKHPLELLNPAAPARYGSGADNVVRYPFSGTSPMLKLVSIEF